MIATPALARAGRALGRRFERYDHGDLPKDPDRTELGGHVVIGGFGRVGQMIARILEREGIPFVAVDMSAELCSEHTRSGRVMCFGDAARPELLERAGADNARAFVVTIDAPAAAERMVRTIRRRRPDAPVYARARDVRHAQALAKLGAVVVPEALEGSLQLAERVLEGLEIPDEALIRTLDEERRLQAENLRAEPT